MSTPTTLAGQCAGALLAAAGSFVTVWIARNKGFFHTTWKKRNGANVDASSMGKRIHLPTLPLVILVFAIYVIGGVTVPTFLNQIFSINIAQIAFLSAAVILGFLLAFLFLIAKPIRKGIWRSRPDVNVKQDAILAFSAWVISFPLVILVGTLLEIILYLFTGTFDFPDQIAIAFLKMTFEHAFNFILAAISIVCFAPLIEEILFRGFLQSYLLRYCSPLSAIAISSFCFTCFHYSGEQGLGNIPILGSLFLLGCFLGFLYERQKSLLSPLILHATFNTLSILNLYFLGT
jgi:membrane protease YdiL (CAAX protease family)